MTYDDILYEVKDGAATITINRPEKYNAFRGQTCEELIDAFNRAGWDKSVGVVVLTGAGEKAFCTGGDQSAHEGQYDGRGIIGLPMEDLHSIIRDIPKPVIAKVQGFAIGGGNVLATVCDMTIADRARAGEAELQHGHRAPARHRRDGDAGPVALLRHGREQGRRHRLQGETQTRFPQVREVTAPAPGLRRPGALGGLEEARCRRFSTPRN